jgi:DNA-binding transcriptional MocR family regulator
LAGSLAEGLGAVSERDLDALIYASTPRGSATDREAAAAWLANRLPTVDPDLILFSNGTQSAVLLLLQALVPAGKMLAAECLSYGMLRSLAEVARVPVEGMPIDDDGLIPDALDRACESGRIGALYCNPTFHNPTASVMSLNRRHAIIEIARRHSIMIIEDDPLGTLYPELPPPLAALAPRQVWHVAGLTKSIAQGMRLAYVTAPNHAARDALLAHAERLSHWVAAPLCLALATWLIQSGQGQAIRDAIAQENLAREATAKRLLGRHGIEGARGSPHLWIPLSPELERVVTDALEADGVKVRGEELFRVDDAPGAPSGIRLSLSSPKDRQSMVDGLECIGVHLDRVISPQQFARKEVR